MTFPPERAAALAVICSMCVRAIFNSTFRKHQSLSKSKRNHCQLNKFWTLNSKTHHNSSHFFPFPTCTTDNKRTRGRGSQLLTDIDGVNTAYTNSRIYFRNISPFTLPTTEILSGKNARAWVSMDFT